MDIEKMVSGAKRFLGVATLASSVYLGGCREEGPIDVNLGKQSGGEISGRVVWDPDGNGVYEGASNAGVSLGGSIPYGSCAAHTGKFHCTTSSSDGGFSFHNVPEGTYSIKIGKLINNPSVYRAFNCFTDVTVTKQNVTRTGDLKIKESEGLVSGSCR